MGDPFTAGVDPFKGVAASIGTTTGSPSAMPGMPSMTSSLSSAAPTKCSAPKSADLMLTAQGAMFDTDCLAAPAGQPITISFDNKDPSVPHNVSIYTDESAKKALFTGDLVTGPKKVTYDVGTLPAGTYFFRCDVHPTTMTGTLTVS
jgi:plastocyanin